MLTIIITINVVIICKLERVCTRWCLKFLPTVKIDEAGMGEKWTGLPVPRGHLSTELRPEARSPNSWFRGISLFQAASLRDHANLLTFTQCGHILLCWNGDLKTAKCLKSYTCQINLWIGSQRQLMSSWQECSHCPLLVSHAHCVVHCYF